MSIDFDDRFLSIPSGLTAINCYSLIFYIVLNIFLKASKLYFFFLYFILYIFLNIIPKARKLYFLCFIMYNFLNIILKARKLYFLCFILYIFLNIILKARKLYIFYITLVHQDFIFTILWSDLSNPPRIHL